MLHMIRHYIYKKIKLVESAIVIIKLCHFSLRLVNKMSLLLKAAAQSVLLPVTYFWFRTHQLRTAGPGHGFYSELYHHVMTSYVSVWQ